MAAAQNPQSVQSYNSIQYNAFCKKNNDKSQSIQCGFCLDFLISASDAVE